MDDIFEIDVVREEIASSIVVEGEKREVMFFINLSFLLNFEFFL